LDRRVSDQLAQLMFQKFPQIAQHAPTDVQELVLFRITPRNRFRCRLL
jgi:hypothetical protein